MAGFFCFLAYGAGRATNAQSSRNLRFLPHALAGEALMKNKKSWTKFFCSRQGIKGPWADDWMRELQLAGMPGDDYIMMAPNATYDEWLGRPAEYHDIRRGLHFLLSIQLGMPIQEAVEYNPHSFRHFMVEAGNQLRAIKVCSDDDLERVGHWSKGSPMPQSYDNASGVSELSARHKIIDAFRRGWRPTEEGELPNPLPDGSKAASSSSAAPVRAFVASRKTRKIHVVREGMRKTVCSFVSTGTRECPNPGVDWDVRPQDFTFCKPCGGEALGSTAEAMGARSSQ